MGEQRRRKRGQHNCRQQQVDKDNFKDEILVDPPSRGVASSGDSFSYKFQGQHLAWEGGHPSAPSHPCTTVLVLQVLASSPPAWRAGFSVFGGGLLVDITPPKLITPQSNNSVSHFVSCDVRVPQRSSSYYRN